LVLKTHKLIDGGDALKGEVNGKFVYGGGGRGYLFEVVRGAVNVWGGNLEFRLQKICCLCLWCSVLLLLLVLVLVLLL
jgi:hypothetical protein